MADLNLAVFERALDKLSAPLKNITAATGRFRDKLGAAERAARNLSERKSDLGRRFTGATSGIAGQSRELRRWGGATRNYLGGIGGLATAAHKIGLGFVGIGYAVKREIVDSAASFERFRTALETVEGSSGKARSSMDWISSFAVKTPFELEQVTDAFVNLRSDGMDPTQGLLHTLGDASAATGKPLMQAVAAMAGAVSGDNEGLGEFGIEARAAEGGKIRYEYTVDGETKVAEAMAADRAQIQQVLSGILEVKFGGAMAEESKTFMGMLGNLAEQWTRFQNMVMASGLFDWLTGRLGRLLDTLDRMAASGELQQWAKRVGDGLMTAFQQAWEIGKQLWPVVTGIASAIGKAANAVGGFGNLFKILVGLQIAKGLWPMTEGIRDLGGGVVRGVVDEHYGMVRVVEPGRNGRIAGLGDRRGHPDSRGADAGAAEVGPRQGQGHAAGVRRPNRAAVEADGGGRSDRGDDGGGGAARRAGRADAATGANPHARRGGPGAEPACACPHASGAAGFSFASREPAGRSVFSFADRQQHPHAVDHSSAARRGRPGAGRARAPRDRTPPPGEQQRGAVRRAMR